MNMAPVVPLLWYQILAAILFTIGVVGVLVRRSALVIFMSIELMLNAVNLSLLAFSRFRSASRSSCPSSATGKRRAWTKSTS